MDAGAVCTYNIWDEVLINTPQLQMKQEEEPPLHQQVHRMSPAPPRIFRSYTSADITSEFLSIEVLTTLFTWNIKELQMVQMHNKLCFNVDIV